MSAVAELQAAIVAALRASDAIAGVASGVFDAAPPRAAYPYVVIADGVTLDWSTKSSRGREHRVALTVWDEAGRTARLTDLVDAVERALDALPPALPTNRIASCVLLRSRIVRPGDGPWGGLVEYRIRTFQT